MGGGSSRPSGPTKAPPIIREEQPPALGIVSFGLGDAQGCTWKGKGECRLTVAAGLSSSGAKLYREQGTIMESECDKFEFDKAKVQKQQMSLEEFKTNLKAGVYYQKIPGWTDQQRAIARLAGTTHLDPGGGYCKQLVVSDSDLRDAKTLEAIPWDKATNPTIRKMTSAGGYSSITKLFIKPSIPFKVTFNGETYTISLMTLYHPSPVRLENVQHDAMLTLGDPGAGNRAKGSGPTDAVILIPLVGSLRAGPSGEFISKVARYMTGVLQPDPVTGQYNTIDIPTGNDWDLSKLFPGTPNNGETVVTTGYYVWSASAGAVKSTTPRIQTNPFPNADVWTYPYIPAGNSNVRYIMLKDPVPVNVFDLQTVRMLPATPAEQAIDPFIPSTLSTVTPKTCSTTPSASGRESMTNPETCDPFAGVQSNALTQDTLVQIVTGVLTTFGVLLAIYFAVKLFANTDWGFKLPRWGHLFGNYALNAPLTKAEKIPPTSQFTSVAEEHDDDLARRAAERLGTVAAPVENPLAKNPAVEKARIEAEAEAKKKADEEARLIEQARIEAEAEAKKKADEEEALQLIEDAEAEAEAEAKRREEEERLRAPGAAGTGLLGLDTLRENAEQEEARKKAEADLKRAEEERQVLERKADEAEAKAREREKAFKALEAEAEQAPRPRGKFAKTVVAGPKVPPPIIADALKKKEAEQKKAEEAAAALAKQEEEVKRAEKEAEIKRLAEEAAKSASRAAERQTKSLAEPIMRTKEDLLERAKAEAERQRKEYAEKQAEEARTTAPGADGRASASVPSAIGVPPPEARKKQEEILDAYESAVKAYEANPTPETERKARGAESRAKGPAQNTPELKKRYMELVQQFERVKADVQKAHDKAESTREGLMKRLDDRMRGVKSARTDVTLLWQRNPTPIALKGREDKVQGELDRLQTVIRDTKEKVSQVEPEDRALLTFKIKEAEKLVAEQQKVSQSNYAAFKEIKPVLGVKGGRRRMKRKTTRRYVA